MFVNLLMLVFGFNGSTIKNCPNIDECFVLDKYFTLDKTEKTIVIKDLVRGTALEFLIIRDTKKKLLLRSTKKEQYFYGELTNKYFILKPRRVEWSLQWNFD
jgi:hypothetical protein